MSLVKAIKEIMNTRGLQTAEVARRLAGDKDYDRATFYRLLSGATTEPRLGTFIGLCAALEVSPTEILQLAELWPYRERPSDAIDLRLRTAFAQLQDLPSAEKRRAARIVAGIAETYRDDVHVERVAE